MRISIIGHAGSGKSTLAERISKKFNIPHLHIDRIWFEAGGHVGQGADELAKERVREHIRTQVTQLIAGESWVSDGWYGHVQSLIAARADKVVFLDIPLYRRLWNHIRRILRPERHPELTVWDDIKFIRLIIRRTFLHGPAIRTFIKEQGEKAITLHNYKEAEAFFANLHN